MVCVPGLVYSKCVCFSYICHGVIIYAYSFEMVDNLMSQAVFLYCCPDFPSCPDDAIQLGQAILANWTAIKKCSLYYTHTRSLVSSYAVCFLQRGGGRPVDLFEKEPLKGNCEVHLHTPSRCEPSTRLTH